MARKWLVPLAVVLVGTVLRFWRLQELALLGDESYYWLWSRHLSWAYFDHPAGTALLVRLSTALGGQSEIGIRWLNTSLSLACVPLAYRLGAQMLSRRAGLLAAMAVAVGAPYLLTARFVYTDALQLFVMLLNLSLFWRLVERCPVLDPSTVLAFGLSLAVLFNTKYSAYLYALALLAAVLMDHRRLLSARRAWLGAFVGALGLVPVLAWNAMHNWASFRWQLAHLGFNLVGDHSLLGSLGHSLAYLSWPLAAMALLGIGRIRNPAERLLSLVACFLLLPVALSPANSPRNLSTGLVMLLLLCGTRWPSGLQARGQKRTAGLLLMVAAAIAIYGGGTVIDLFSHSVWPASSAVSDIRRDAAGWKELGPALATYPEPVFALDYSIASQIWYYSGRPAYTSWGQYRIWGVPHLSNATVVSLDYLPEELVSSRLSRAFRFVDGPQVLRYEERNATKEVRLWQAEGLQTDTEAFLRQFDFLHLLQSASSVPP
jgi:4-amino-4-deoxy-L-arabinose transferase-like glycosyltransferase